MKTYLFVLLFAALPLFTLAQKKASIDLVVGGDYSFRTLNPTSEDETTLLLTNYRNSVEQGIFTHRFGLNLNQQIARGFFFRVGIQLGVIGYEDEVQGLIWPSTVGPNGEFIPGPSPFETYQQLRYSTFVQVPIAGRWGRKTGKWRPFVELGLIPSFYVRTRFKTFVNQEKVVHVDRSEFINAFQLATLVSVGVSYELTEKLQLFGQPIFRYHLTPTFSSEIRENAYSLGIELGVRRTL